MADNNILPNALDAYRKRAMELYQQGSDLYNTEPDTTQIQAFARQRGNEGEGAMLNALAAQFAGEGFAPVQAQFLKKAAAAQEPIKMGAGMLTPDGQFIKDPFGAQDKRAEFLMQQAKAYETLAQTADTARARLEADKKAQEFQNQLRLMGLQMQQQSLDLRGVMAQNALNQQMQTNLERHNNKINEGTAALSKRFEEIAPLYSSVQQLNQTLEKYIPQGKDVPGFGPMSNIKFGPLDISGWTMGQEGKDVRSQLMSVFNSLLKSQSGQAVTLPEEGRKQLELMVSKGLNGYTEADTLNAYRNIVLPALNTSLANLAGGYNPEVKERYRAQGGKVDFNSPIVAPQRGSVLPKATGAAQGQTGSGLSAQEQQELDALRKRFGR